jgi:uncharacterized coiled-coil protein SlyX
LTDVLPTLTTRTFIAGHDIVPGMDDHLVELEIRLAYQDRKIEELDKLVRALVPRLESAERDLLEIKRAMTPEEHINEPPPHY